MLERIVGATREELERRRSTTPLARLEAALDQRPAGRPFGEALAAPGISVIAEHKRRSPSAGVLREGSSVADIVQAYERGGAAAISVLTEEQHFGGSLEDLQAAVAATELPVLRKDFIVDPYQLYESAAAGADAILLIVAALDHDDLYELHREARGLDLDVLVEVHDEAELSARSTSTPRSSASTTATSPTSPSTSSAPTSCSRTSRPARPSCRSPASRPASSSTTSTASASTPCWWGRR